MKMMAYMQEQQALTCQGSGYAEFALFDHALGRHSEKKRRQHRAARFKEWYVPGMKVLRTMKSAQVDIQWCCSSSAVTVQPGQVQLREKGVCSKDELTVL